MSKLQRIGVSAVLALAVAGVGMGLDRSTFAATDIWSGTANDGSWATGGTGGNWTGAAVPGAADTAQFSSAGTAISLNGAAQSLNSFNFTTSVGNFTFNTGGTGGQFNLASGGAISLLSTATGTNLTETFNTPMSLGGNYTFTNARSDAGSSLVFAGNITNSATSTLTISGAGTGTGNLISGNISDGTGTQSLTVSTSNGGKWTLSGANSYSGLTTLSGTGSTFVFSGTNSSAGATTITGGTVQLNNSNNGGLASGTLTISAGALQSLVPSLALSNPISFSGISTTGISGAQSITFNGAFTQSASATLYSNITGGNTLTLGTVNIGAATGSGYTLTVAGSGNTTFGGVIQDYSGGVGTAHGALTIANTGTTTLSAANTYGGATTLSGGTLALTGSLTGSNIVVNGSASNFIESGSGVIAGAGSTFTLTAGSAALSGSNTYGGATTITTGTLTLDFSGPGAAANQIINSGNALTLGHGVLSVKGAGTAVSNTQTLGTITNTASIGVSSIVVNNNGGSGTTTLALSAAGLGARGTIDTLNIDLSQGLSGNASGNAITTTAAAAILGWATVKDATSTGFARYTGSGVVRLTGQAALANNSNGSATDFITSPSGTSSSGSPYLQLNSSLAPVWNTITIDTTGATGANSLDLNSNAVALTQNALLMTGTSDFTIQNGQIGAAGSEMIVHQMGTGVLSISGTVSSGAGGLTKSGAGTLVLSGANTFTGATVINQGTLQLNNANALQYSTVTVNPGGALAFHAGSGPFSIGGLSGSFGLALSDTASAALTLNVGGTSTTSSYSGVLSGAGGGINKVGSGTFTLSGANTYTGGTTVSSGTLKVNGATALGANASAVSVTAGAALDLNGQTMTNTNALTLNGTGVSSSGALTNSSPYSAGTYAGLVTLGSNSTIGGLGSITLSNTGTIYGTSTGLGLTLAGTGGGTISSIINGGINGAPGAGTVTVNLGTWNLNGVNSYTGATNVNGGLLKVGSSGTGSTSASSAVNVAGGAIGGYGTINGAVSLSGTGGIDLRDGGTHTLTLGSTLAITGAAGANNLYFDLSSTATDKIAVTGAVSMTTPNGAVINLYQNGGVGSRLTPGTYDLITSASTTLMPAASNFTLATTKAYGETFALALDATSKKLQVTAAKATSVTPAAFWTGASGANWSTAGNWNGLVTGGSANTAAPDYGTNVTLSATSPAPQNLATNLDTDTDINSLTFNAAAGGVSIGGTRMLSIEATNANGNTAGNGITTSNTSGTNTIAANVGLAASQTWTVSTGGTLAVSGGVTDFGGAYALTKAGTGTLILSGSNTYSGGTSLNAGTLVIGNNSALGSGLITMGSGSVTIKGDSQPRTISNTLVNNSGGSIGGYANLTFTGGGTIGTPAYVKPQYQNSTIAINNPATTTFSGVFALTNSMSGTNNGGYNLNFGSSANVVISGPIQDNVVGNATYGAGSNALACSFTGAGANITINPAANNGYGNNAMTMIAPDNAYNTVTIGGPGGSGATITPFGATQVGLNGGNTLYLAAATSGQLLANNLFASGGSGMNVGFVGANSMTLAGTWTNSEYGGGSFTNLATGTFTFGNMLTTSSAGGLASPSTQSFAGSGNTLFNSNATLNLAPAPFVVTQSGTTTFANANNDISTTTFSGGTVVLDYSASSAGGGSNRLGQNIATTNNGSALTLGGVNLQLSGGSFAQTLGSGRTLTLTTSSSSSTPNGSYTIQLASTAGVVVGTPISGTGIPSYDYITGVNTSTGVITLFGATNAVIAGGGSLSTFQTGGTANGTTLWAGQSRITQTNSGTSTIALGGISRNAGGTLDFGTGVATTTTTNSASILGGWATVNGADWAVANGGSSAITALPSTSYNTTLTNTAGTDTNNTFITDSATLGNVARTTNSLKITDTQTGQQLTIGATGTLGLTSGGILFVGAKDYTITGGNLSSGGEIIVQQNGNGILTIASTITNASSNLTKAGSGMLVLSGTNSYTGTTYLNQGTVSISASANLGSTNSIAFNGGTLEVTGSGFTTARTISLGANGGTFQIDSGTLTLNSTAVISGTSYASLSKTGAGTLVLQAADSFVGPVTVTAGTLQLGSATALGASSTGSNRAAAPLLVNGGTLDINGQTTGLGNVTLQSGTIADTATTKGTLAAYSFTLQSGTVGAAMVDLVISGNSSNSINLYKTTAGTVTLTGANTYSGDTLICGGTLQIGNGGTSGQLGAGNVNTSAALPPGATGTATPGTLAFNRSNTYSVSNAITGSGGVTQAGSGTTILTGANSYTGTTTVTAGTLQAASASSFGTNAAWVLGGGTLDVAGNAMSVGSLNGTSGAVINSGAATILTVGTDGTNASYGGTIASSFSLNKVGTGVLSLANVPSGSVTISSGKLQVAPGGSPNVLETVSSLSITPGCSLDLTNHDLLVTNGLANSLTMANYRGNVTTNTSVSGSTAPTTIALVSGKDYKAVTGTSALNDNDLYGKFTFKGDANLDGSITADDYLALDVGYLFGLTGWTHGDFEQTGKAPTAADYADIDLSYANQNGKTAAAGEIALHTQWFGAAYTDAFNALSAPAVPEPGSVGLLAVGALALLRRKGRK